MKENERIGLEEIYLNQTPIGQTILYFAERCRRASYSKDDSEAKRCAELSLCIERALLEYISERPQQPQQDLPNTGDIAEAIKKEQEDKIKLDELRRVVREFLYEISGVPMRAVDCNQNRVDQLRKKLTQLSGWRGVQSCRKE